MNAIEESNNNLHIQFTMTQAEALTIVTLLRYQAREQRNQNGGVGYEIGALYERVAAKIMHDAVGRGLAKRVEDFEALPRELSRVALLGGVITDAGHALMQARDEIAKHEQFGHFAALRFEDVRDLGNSITLAVSHFMAEDETVERLNQRYLM